MKEVLELKTVESFLSWRKSLKLRPAGVPSLGFVPTMGALHEGHAELVRLAKSENEIVLMSIFVNPTQFNDPRDFEKYPQSLASDRQKARDWGVDAIFSPDRDELYPDDYTYRVQELRDSLDLCGEFRPGHFDGVLSVVMKLFLLASPQRAYFGEKDFQQLQLIKGMVKAFFMDIEIRAVPTQRSESGLALSSRNSRLTLAQQLEAEKLPKILRSSKTDQEASKALLESGFEVDYVKTKWGRRLAAVHLGGVRLIDNVEIV